MTVRCKMKCIEKTNRTSPYDAHAKPTCSVVLHAVQGEENKTWAQYTPSGRIELQIDNPDAYGAFVLGHTYFVDFNVAPAKEADEK